MSEIPPIQGITRRTIQSSTWMYGRMIFTNIINLGVMVILARQLTPADFGLVALAQVLLRFLAVIGSSGVGEFVIYDNSAGREERTHAAFWLGMAFAFLVTTIGLLVKPYLTRFYTDSGLDTILLLLLIRYPLDQLSTVPDALIKKSLDYKQLVIRDTVLEIFTSLASMILALTGFGVLSLVIPSMVTSPFRAIIVFWMSKWHPTLPFRFRLWKEIFKYSTSVIGSSLATTISAEGDTLIIGKALGSTQLGLYNLSWQSANLVSRTVTGVVGKLAMPALSAVANEPERLRNAYRKMIRTLGFVSFPLLVGLFVVADLFILTVYGLQWKESILPLQILIIYALRHTVGSPLSTIPYVVGRPDLAMKYSLAFIPFYLLSIWIGSKYGILGVAIGVTLARTSFGIIQFQLGARLVQEKLNAVFNELKKPFIAAILMGGLVWLCKIGIQQVADTNLVVFLILILIGGITYLGVLRLLFKKDLIELIKLMDSLSPRISSFINHIVFNN